MSSPDKVDNFKEYFLLEKDRIESFQTWPFDDKSSCNKLKMAQAGFYWNGSKHDPDTTTCFVCNKTLDGWEKTDDPWKEHSKHAPQCAFVKYGRPEAELTVREFLKILAVVVRNKSSRDIEKVKSNLRLYAAKELDTFNQIKIEKRQ